jgi:hypothetical protein
MPELPDASLAWEDLSTVDRRALTEMLVDKIVTLRILTRSSMAGATTSSAPSRTKIPSGRLNGSRRCMRRGSRSSPESEQRRRAKRSPGRAMRLAGPMT